MVKRRGDRAERGGGTERVGHREVGGGGEERG